MRGRAMLADVPADAGAGRASYSTVTVGGEIGWRIGDLPGLGAGGMQVGLIGFGGSEEIEEILQAVLDRPEVGAIAPALADVE